MAEKQSVVVCCHEPAVINMCN